MSTLRFPKKLLFGEMWLVPLGVAAAVAVTGGLLRGSAASARIDGFLLLAGGLTVLLLSVARSARPWIRGPAKARSDAAAAAPREPCSITTHPDGVSGA